MHAFKKDLILQFAALASEPASPSNHLVLLTSAGIITGDIILDDEKDPDVSSLTKFTTDTAMDYRKEYQLPDDSHLDGNDGCICLKNVTINLSRVTTHIPFLSVFFDQIIAVSIGNLDVPLS